MNDSIQIQGIPIPPQELSPNARPHFAAKAKKTEAQRNAAKLLAMHAVAQLNDWRAFEFPWRRVAVQPVWYRKTRRVIDADNALAMLKSTFDGIVDSGVLDDDRELIQLPIIFEHDKDDPRIEITLTKHIAGVCPLCKTTIEEIWSDGR